jgi:hypothetical protein
MFSMRTTLTLDDDLARELKERARRSGSSFKEVVNDAVRRGLSLGEKPPSKPEPFVVEPHEGGFRAGVDPLKLNQLLDELEIGEFESLRTRDRQSR